MSLVKKIVLRTALVVLFVFGGLIINTLRQGSLQGRYDGALPPEAQELRPQYMERLAKALTFKTISQDPRMLDSAAFDGLVNHLIHEFPLTFEHLNLTRFGSHTLLLHWPGTLRSDQAPRDDTAAKARSAQAKNFLFIAHLDVVPVDRQSLDDWVAPPFEGNWATEQEQRYLYGRGTLDDKSSALALLESVENLLAGGAFAPKHDLYFCFGQDEELGGRHGAAQVARHMDSLELQFESALDEGGIISLGSIPGLEDVPVALIGTAEKGYVSVEVSFNLPGGHSSMPERESALTRAAAFAQSLSEEPLFAPKFAPSLQGFIEHLGPELPLPLRTVFSNLWLFERVLFSVYAQTNVGRALIQTTAAPTLFSAGIKDNVIPASARVVCNSRILPGTSVEEVLAAYQKRAGQYGGTVRRYDETEGSEASTTSSTEHPAFAALGQSTRDVFPSALVSPYLTIGGTDSKHFEGLCKNTYRFLPLVLTPQEVASIHGTNERISEDAFRQMLFFYQNILQRWGTLEHVDLE